MGYFPPSNSQVESIRESLNRADPNSVADIERIIALGDVLRAAPIQLTGVVPLLAAASSPPQVATSVYAVPLPEDAKAAYVLRAYVKASSSGIAVGTELTNKSLNAYTTPTTGTYGIAPNGDIVLYEGDAITSIDILYIPRIGDVYGSLANSKYGVTRLTLSVNSTTGFAALPSAISGKAHLLMFAAVTAGSVLTPNCLILAPASAVVATKSAALSTDGTGIWFNQSTDLPTQCQVDVLVYSGYGPSAGTAGGGNVNVNALLENASSST
jgi:hypothetical protein